MVNILPKQAALLVWKWELSQPGAKTQPDLIFLKSTSYFTVLYTRNTLNSSPDLPSLDPVVLLLNSFSLTAISRSD